MGLRTHKACHNLGILLHELGRAEDAERHWRLALSTAPKFLPAWLSLGDLYLKQARFEEMKDIIWHVKQLPNGQLDATLLLARQHMTHREFDVAKSIVNAMIGEHPTLLGPRVVLSHVLLQEGKDWSAAEKALRDVLAIDPNHAEAQRNLSVLFEKMTSWCQTNERVANRPSNERN
jgi:tetratricopeptide (TPR) repeat protein